MCVCVVCTYVWMTQWAPNRNIRVSGIHSPWPSPPSWCGHQSNKRKGLIHGYTPQGHCQVQGPGSSQKVKNPTFRKGAGEGGPFLMFLLIGKKKKNGRMKLSELTSVSSCLAVSISLWSKDHSPTRGRREEPPLSAEAPRQSWIIYLFCNSFLSNILFLSLAIKNWNASFSVMS